MPTESVQFIGQMGPYYKYTIKSAMSLHSDN